MSARRLPVLVEQGIATLQAQAVRLATDQMFQVQQDGMTPQCRVRCDACCHHPLMISVFEAIPIYRFLIRRGHWLPAFKRALDASWRQTIGLTLDVWLMSRIPCPLLKDHKCIAYGNRPFQCRVTVSVGDPYYCDPLELGSSTAIISRDAWMVQYNQALRKVGETHGVRSVTVPIGKALLLAEQVVSGQIDIEAVSQEMLKAYRLDSQEMKAGS